MPGHKLRLERIRQGLCGECGEPRNPPGGPKGTETMCRRCAAEHSRKQSELKTRLIAERDAAGQCLDCGEQRLDERSRPRPPGEKLCWQCEDKRRHRHRRYYQNLKSA